jgi:HK97 family phage major capsid protein
MLTMTPALKDHLVKSFGLKSDATDDEATKLAAAKYAADEITADKLKELTTVANPKEKVSELGKAVAAELAPALGAAIADALKAHKPAEPPKEDDQTAAFQKRMDEMAAKFEASAAEHVKKLQQRVDDATPKGPGVAVLDIVKMGIGLSKETDPVSLRVKEISERYSHKRYPATRNTKTTDPESKIIRRFGSHGPQLETPSEYRKALGAVWLKFTVAPEYLTPNDRPILAHILHKEKFIIHGDHQDGAVDPRTCEPPRYLTEKEIHDMVMKATVVIADNTSGGNYATPEFFDTDFILLPILGGELAPLCNIVDVPRGTAAQGFMMSNPSWTSGLTEGTGLTPFTTDSFLGNKDRSFFRAGNAIHFGLNFLEDAVPGMIEQTMDRIMAKAAEWLDEQVAVGDGSTEPEGIFVANGTTDVTFNTATTGPYVIGDVLELLFGVAKAYRQAYASNRAAFVMTDTTYQSIRSIATGVTGDARLLFGMDVESYMLFNHPVAIVATTLTNDQLAFVQCGGYRLYRRQGVRFRRSSEGRTNILANQMMLAYDMRNGGALDRGGYCAVTNSGIP